MAWGSEVNEQVVAATGLGLPALPKGVRAEWGAGGPPSSTSNTTGSWGSGPRSKSRVGGVQYSAGHTPLNSSILTLMQVVMIATSVGPILLGASRMRW